MKRSIRSLCMAALLALCLSGISFAAEPQVLSHAEYCFTETDFLRNEPELPGGIFVTAVPEKELATIYLGERSICAGDVLCSTDLSNLRLAPTGRGIGQAVLCYRPIFGSVLGEASQIRVRICSGKNQSPTAESDSIETYKNIPNEGKLRANDPEEAPLTYRLETAPKRGSVEIREDGSYLYTPKKNKVGEDSFTFTVMDEAGNVSAPATIRITILKPSEAMSFADLEGSADHFVALWMAEQGLTQGEKIGDVLCFRPQETVSRQEFLRMVMKLYDMETETESVNCFADCQEEWLQPYLTAALRSGLIRGESSEAGLIFRGDDPITAAEAAVLLQNMKQFPVPVSAPDDAAPAWARASLAAMTDAGIHFPQAQTPLSRLDAAKLLYESSKLK